MADIRILGIPMDLGAGRRGVDMGPSALRLARLADTLRDLGHAVLDLGNVEVPVAEAVPRTATDPGSRRPAAAPPGAGGTPTHAAGTLHFPEAIAATCRAAYQRLAELPEDHFAIALGGDHSIAMGTVAGLATRGRTGIIWVDAHADLNTPASSPSGNIHGMPVAHLLGQGDPRLLAVWGGGAVLRPEDIVYIGLRSLDAEERRAIAALGIQAFTMKDLDQRGIARVAQDALAHLGSVERMHVSFDADVLDPDLAPGVGTPVPGGITYREAHLLMELLADGGRVSSLDLVEVNPILDVRNRTAAIMVEMAASLLGKKIL